MPEEGFISGLLGGLASGTADQMYQQHEQQVQQDLASKKFMIEAISHMTERPDFKPEMFPIALQHIQQLFSTKPGGKKTGKEQGNIMESFSSLIKPQPSAEKVKQVDPTGRRERTAMQEQQAPGEFPAGFSPIPGVDPMFKTPGEMAGEEFRAKKPALEFGLKKQEEHDEAMLKRQVQIENMREISRERVERLKAQLKEEATPAKMKELIAAGEAQGMDPETARTWAGERVTEALSDKHQTEVKRREHITNEDKIAVQRLEDAQKRTAIMGATLKLHVQKQAFDQQQSAIKESLVGPTKDLEAANGEINRLMGARAQLAKTKAADATQLEALNKSIAHIDQQITEADVKRQNAIEAIKKATEATERLAGGAPQGMPPVPVDPAMKAYADKYFNGDVEKAKAYAAAHP